MTADKQVLHYHRLANHFSDTLVTAPVGGTCGGFLCDEMVSSSTAKWICTLCRIVTSRVIDYALLLCEGTRCLPFSLQDFVYRTLHHGRDQTVPDLRPFKNILNCNISQPLTASWSNTPLDCLYACLLVVMHADRPGLSVSDQGTW